MANCLSRVGIPQKQRQGRAGHAGRREERGGSKANKIYVCLKADAWV